MADGVKFIFKTLLKVPVIIFIFYFVFNIFCFAHTYFKALGFSYVIMQTAVENNYIPASEQAALEEYCKILNNSSEMMSSVQIVAEGASGNNQKQQYGKQFTAGVTYRYRVIWPLMPYEQHNNYDVNSNEYADVEGFGGTDTTGGFASEKEMEDRLSDSRHDISFPITITYTVPGLKYYADLAY